MDEQQPQQPEQPAEEKDPKDLAAKEKMVKNRGFLEKLPPPVRQELDDQIRLKNPNSARKYMTEKYGQQFPTLLNIAKPSWYAYAKKYSLKGSTTTELQTEIVGTPPELLNAIDKIADQNATITDKRAALTALYHDCDRTSKRLEASQVNFLDPQIQAVILANRKQMCTIVEKLAVINDQLSKDSDKNWLEEAEYLIQVCTSAVVNSYKITHTDQSNFARFIGDYKMRLQDLLKSYRATKETLQKETVKG